MKTTRRLFLKRGAIAVASVGLAPSLGPYFVSNMAFAEEPRRAGGGTGGRKVLICIFQRGAVDGMSMVAPHGDPYYYQHRSAGGGGIALARAGEGSVLDLDSTFGLHPALSPLKPIYDAGHLAPIHACGSPNSTRSHFDAQDYMETAVPGNKGVHDGWLARTLECCPEDQARMHSVFRGVAVASRLPRALWGSEALAIPDLRTFGLKGAVDTPPDPNPTGMEDDPSHGADSQGSLQTSFEAMYDQASGDILHGTGQETFEALRMVKAITARPYLPASGAEYPAGPFGQSLQQIAQLIKANVGLEVAFAQSGGWDTHANQGGAQGRLANNLKQFGQGLAALYADLGDRMSDVVVLTMSEFGRTARQNGNGGTDHGHATCFLAMGGPVNGGKVLGQWPGLAPEQLHEGRDLEVTTDFRDVFGEVAQKHLGVRDLRAVFPSYAASPGQFRGVLRA